MSKSDTMSPEETVSKSPLNKPLHLLTEDDISQLTREDCRRYLKDKGMRRPSWNKSQAIQQVILLKTLLETTSDSDAGTLKKLYIPRSESPQPQRVHRGTSVNTEISISANESVPYHRKDPDKSTCSGHLSGRLVAAENDSFPTRNIGVTNELVGQMTIFYCGKVNVYDDVPADKAQAIMQLAASPLHLPQQASYDGTTSVHSLPGHLQATTVKVAPDSSVMLLPPLQTVRMSDNSRLHREESTIYPEVAECPASRKASVQRYLEKRKDRFKSKRKVGTSCTSMDVYLNHQIGNQTPNEDSKRSGACSPTPIKSPNTPNRCSSVENANLSTGLNNKDLQD